MTIFYDNLRKYCIIGGVAQISRKAVCQIYFGVTTNMMQKSCCFYGFWGYDSKQLILNIH